MAVKMLFIVTDVFLWIEIACPTPDKTVESTTMALRTFAGKRIIHKLYAYSSGEISRSLQTVGIMPQGSHPGVPQTNGVAERATGDVLAGTRSLLLAAGLPYFCSGNMQVYVIVSWIMWVVLTVRASALGIGPMGMT